MILEFKIRKIKYLSLAPFSLLIGMFGTTFFFGRGGIFVPDIEARVKSLGLLKDGNRDGFSISQIEIKKMK